MATAPVLPEEDDDRPQGMDDNELASLLAAHEQAAVGYYNSEIANEQAKAIKYYYGDVSDDVPRLDGCSAAVDHSVAIMVDNGLAAVLKPFVSAEEVVSFEPRGPEDVKVAEQATEYVNYVIQCDNPGFLIFHDWFKDALLTKVGVVKVWWEDQSKTSVQSAMVDALGLEQARTNDNYLGEMDQGNGMFAVQLQQVEADGRVKIEGVPPEEFKISPFARSIDSAAYVAHHPSNFTRSDLVEMGVDREIADSLPASSSQTNEEARSQARYADEDWGSDNRVNRSNDKSRDVLDIRDEYVRVDYDGDGVSELRRVVRVDDVILLNEEIYEAPFALLCPCPMPHKVYGRSTADQSMEGQRIGTAVLRQTLDNLYKSNNPRPIVGQGALARDGVTLQDLGDSSPGAIIRAADATQLGWNVVPFAAQHSFPMLEFVARGIEERTGFQRKGNGLNSETLEKNSPDTATQAAIDENSRNERAEMVARIFAETGVKRLFKLVLGLLVRHQPKARIIRLRNEWVPMDPSGWSPEMDVTISVGLGVGNKSEQIAQADSVLMTMAELQNTPYAYLTTAEHVHNAVKRKYTAAGIKDVDNYISDPSQVQPPPPQPDAEMAKAQAEMQAKQTEMQFKAQEGAMKLQLEQAKASAQIQIERAKAQADAQIQASKLQLEQMKADFEARLALQESQQQFALERVKLEMARLHNAEKAAIQRDTAMSKERPGGALDK